MVLTTVLAVVAAGGGFVSYMYYTLQPEHHFVHVKPIVNRRGSAGQRGLNVLVLGSDARPNDVASHTFSILLCHIDFSTKEYDVLSIPRDSRVYVPGWGHTKLTNVQYLGQSDGDVEKGVMDVVDQVGALTGLPIHYYAETNFWGLQAMVDTIGPIRMTIPFDEILTHSWYAKNRGKVFKKGTYELDGEMGAEVVHERDSLPQGDYSRQRLQEEALIGIANALLKPSNLPKLPAFFHTVPQYMIATNMKEQDMLSFVLAVRSFQPSQVHYFTIEGHSQTAYDDVLKAYSSQIILNQDDLHQIITRYFTT